MAPFPRQGLTTTVRMSLSEHLRRRRTPAHPETPVSARRNGMETTEQPSILQSNEGAEPMAAGGR
jgi:hypothetical protein